MTSTMPAAAGLPDAALQPDAERLLPSTVLAAGRQLVAASAMPHRPVCPSTEPGSLMLLVSDCGVEDAVLCLAMLPVLALLHSAGRLL